MSKYLYVHGWRDHQSYRADRGQPPWIKIHRDLLRNPKWLSLSESERCSLLSIWILAADHDGRVINDAAIIRRACGLDTAPDLNKLISLGLLDANMTSTRRQGDANMTPDRRQLDVNVTTINANLDAPEAETETETEKSSKGAPRRAAGPPLSDVKKAFDNWNIAAEMFQLPKAELLTEKRKRLIRDRLKEHGLDGWNKALEQLEQSEFCRGKNDRGWRADIDFVLMRDRFVKLMEGGYGKTI